MQTPLQIIEQLGIPTHSYIAAATYASEHINLTHQQYQQKIADIFCSDQVPQFENEKIAKIYFLYSVQEWVRASLQGIIDDQYVVDQMNLKAKKFIDQNPWCVNDYSEQHDTIDSEDGSLRKGKKGQIAQQTYQQLNDGDHTRTQIIEALIDKAQMSKSGATTYFHKFKKQFGFDGPTEKTKTKSVNVAQQGSNVVKSKQPKGPTKSSIAEQVYLQNPNLDKKQLVQLISQQANTSLAGANTYYCACKKKHG